MFAMCLGLVLRSNCKTGCDHDKQNGDLNSQTNVFLSTEPVPVYGWTTRIVRRRESGWLRLSGDFYPQFFGQSLADLRWQAIMHMSCA